MNNNKARSLAERADLENVLQDVSLHAGIMDTDRATTDLLTVQHQVVVLTSHLLTQIKKYC